MPARDRNKSNCFRVVANLLDVGTHLFHNLMETRLFEGGGGGGGGGGGISILQKKYAHGHLYRLQKVN